jgi:hypothetical protein
VGVEEERGGEGVEEERGTGCGAEDWSAGGWVVSVVGGCSMGGTVKTGEAEAETRTGDEEADEEELEDSAGDWLASPVTVACEIEDEVEDEGVSDVGTAFMSSDEWTGSDSAWLRSATDSLTSSLACSELRSKPGMAFACDSRLEPVNGVDASTTAGPAL